MLTMRLHIFVLLDIQKRKKVVQERLRSKTIEIKGEIVGTCLIQMLLSNFAKFVQVQLRPRSLDGVQGNHEIAVEQFMRLDSNVAFFFDTIFNLTYKNCKI
jgi:hypothetical protein